jgi:hypothetical protein
MALQAKSQFAAKPKRQTPAERSVEFDAVQAKLKAEAAERRETTPARPRARARTRAR